MVTSLRGGITKFSK